MEKVYIKIKDTIFEELFKNKDIVSIEEVLTELENLMYENKHLEDKNEELENDIENNYEKKQFDPYDYYGVSERDFA